MGFSFLKTSVAGPAPVGLTTIAGQPAITIRRLLGKKKKVYYLQDLGPHSKVLGREKAGTLQEVPSFYSNNKKSFAHTVTRTVIKVGVSFFFKYFLLLFPIQRVHP